jgi:hypothetical protein
MVWMDNSYETYQAVGATIPSDVELSPHISTLEQCREPMEMTARSTTHERAAAIHEVVLLLIWEVLHAGGCASEKTWCTEPRSQLSRR